MTKKKKIKNQTGEKIKTQTQNTSQYQKENILKTLKENRTLLIIFIIIMILGIHFRLTDYAAEGIRTDSITTLAGGLLWFYPHNFYPGMVHYQPAVGHYLIGKSCMTSGADFSEISKVSPFFIPTIPLLIGTPFTEAEANCFSVIYLSSILLLIGIILLSYMILETRSFLYVVAFFALSPTILFFSRMLIIEVITWVFAIYGLIALWKFYTSKKGSKKETFYIIISGIIFGLGTSTKFTLSLYAIFSLFLIIEKYNKNIQTLLKKASIPKPVAYSILSFTLAFILALMIPFQMSIKNLTDVYYAQTNSMGGAELVLSIKALNHIMTLATKSNPIDTFLIIYAFYITYILLIKKEKSQNEKYILYLILLYITSTTLFYTLDYRKSIVFMFAIPLLMSLAFSTKEYSAYNTLLYKIKKPHTYKTIFILIISLYLISSLLLIYPIKPFYSTYKNPITCSILKTICQNNNPNPINKITADELKGILKDNETYYMFPENPDIYVYLNPKDYYNTWNVKTIISASEKRPAELAEIIQNYNRYAAQNNEKILRYIVISRRPDGKDYTDQLANKLLKTHTPKKTVKINNIEVAYIYDLNEFQ